MYCRQCGTAFSIPTIGATIEETSGLEAHECRCENCGASIHSFDEEATQPRQHCLPTQFQIPERFRVDYVLGEGSFGIVSRCWDEKLQRHVAVKVARGAIARNSMFLREARSASQLQHENVVRVFDVGEHLGQVYIVSEWIDGVTLFQWLKSGRRTEDDILRVLIEILHGIHYSHQLGIIHRDLKPGNILVDRGGHPRVLDFGLSQSLGGDGTALSGESRAGTPAFMAPEQVRNTEPTVDHRADLYALGVVLFQLISGELPYSGSVRQVFEAVVSDEVPPSLRERKNSVSKALNAICLKAMSKSADLRYQTAEEFADDLQAYLDGTPMKAYPALHQRRIKRILRSYWLISVACTLMILCAASATVLYQEYRRDNPLPLVTIRTEPEGATLFWTRFDSELGLPENEKPTRSRAGESANLRPGFYKVIAFLGNESVEVFRTVPASVNSVAGMMVDLGEQRIRLKHRTSSVEDGRILLPNINFVPQKRNEAEVATFPAGSIRITGKGLIPVRFSGRAENLTRFAMDVNEVTWKDIKRTWPKILIPAGESETEPATGLTWDVVVAWCEENGRSLPSVFEMVYAATNGGTTFYVNGDTAPQIPAEFIKLGKSGSENLQFWDRTLSQPPVVGLLTGSSEWTCNPFRLLKYDKSGTLIAMPEHLNPMPVNTGNFPQAVYVVMNIPNRVSDSPIVSANLGNLPVRNEFPHLGFRTVRRFHVINTN